MSNSETFNCHKFYKDLDLNYAPFDPYTAASLGDISYFIERDTGRKYPSNHSPNIEGWTPLMFACSRGHSHLVNYLLMSGANRNCKSKSGVTPLMLAISSGDMSTIERIFDISALEEKDYRKWTPLFYAVHFTQEKCLKYLLTRGADANVVDFQNETPLIAAIKLGRERMVELLLKSTKNVNVVSYKQESALMLANESKNSKIQYLVRNHLEYLETLEKRKVTPAKREIDKKGQKLSEHCSPTPIKLKIKSQFEFNTMSKSLTYSPNKSHSPCGPEAEAWKFPFSKKFWSPQLRPKNDVEDFLRNLGLEKYWPIFRDEEVDFETLLTLNEENLKELGIALFGPRKKIYLAIQQMRNKYQF